MSDLFGSIVGNITATVGEGSLSPAFQGQIVRAGIDAGLSANQIYNGLRSVGLGARRSSVLALVRNERAKAAAGDLGAQLGFDEAPTAAQVSEVAEGRAGTYVTRLRVTTDMPNELGGRFLQESWWGITSRAPISLAEAQESLMEIMESGQTGVPGATVRSVEYMGTLLHTGRG